MLCTERCILMDSLRSLQSITLESVEPEAMRKPDSIGSPRVTGLSASRAKTCQECVARKSVHGAYGYDLQL